MATSHTVHFQVRSFDVDAWGEVPPSTLAAYLEQTAWEHSAVLGFGGEWYAAQGTAWVIHRLRLARLAAFGYQDAVAATTWVASMGRVRAQRNYEVRDAAGRVLAVGRADWAYINRARLAPTPVDPALLARFPPGEPLPLPEPPEADPLPAPVRRFAMPRRAYRYEADSVGHVNNTVYLAWFDEALAAALAAAGLPLTRPGGPGLRLAGTWYEVEFPRSALPGDDLTIVSQVTGSTDGGQVLAWAQELQRADGEVLVRCASRQQVRGLAESEVSAEAVLRALLAE